MQTDSKIGKLKAALMQGRVTTPLIAWTQWHMAHNTYHRSLNGLRRRHGMRIRSQLLTENGVTHSMHWDEDAHMTWICSHCGEAFPEGFKHDCRAGNEKGDRSRPLATSPDSTIRLTTVGH